jgi:Ca-activated chloride channel family protein
VSVKEAFDLIRNNLASANMFAFGIGSSVNRHLIEGMAHVGRRTVHHHKTGGSTRKSRSAPHADPVAGADPGQGGLRQIRCVMDVEPASIPDVLADRPVIVFGKWREQAGGTIALSG